MSGAVRELTSAEGLAPQDGDILRALKEKHPSAPKNLSLPDPPGGSVVPAVATEEDVRKAIMSFRAGASGGPDGLRPGHLHSLVAHGSAEAGSCLLSTLTGLVPQFAVPVLYGPNEWAIREKDGGIRPIAVGSSLRRLSVKMGSRPIVQALGEELRPVQLGVSTSGGCEAAAHAARRYARDCRHRRVLLKIDMRNAFNSLRRDSFLSVARVRTPGLYSLLWQAYSSHTRLFFGEEGFASETGIQQGDPIGPALFALSVDEAARGVQSEFNVWYLDDATLGDSSERVYDDLVVLLERLRAIGLEVNGSKCELTILNDSMPEATEALIRGLLPGVRVVEACDLSLLGAPVDIQGIPGTINEKREALERMTSKLEVLNPHQAFDLLKTAFAIPKLQYVLRASPAYLCREELQIFDRAHFGSLGRVTNLSLEGDVCKQAGFPVNFCGLGCRRAEDISLPSFLASMNSVGELMETILSRINIADTNELAEAVESWRGASGDAPLPDDPSRQKAWTFLLLRGIGKTRCADQVCRARLLATAQRERAGLGSMLCRFRRLGHFWTPRVLGLPLPLEWAPMFVFLILAVAAED